jgi:hypothetical protein
MRKRTVTSSGKKAAVLAGALGTLVAASAVLAAPPEAFEMTTQIEFPQDGSPPNGTFSIQAPEWICPEGTFEVIRELYHPAVPGAFTVTAVAIYSCADGTGTFSIKSHPQGNPGNAGDGFLVSGPWAILPRGTGLYMKLSGHGEMGFNGISSDPDTGTEHFVGFVSQ